MDNTKTVKEWLYELPDGYRERALANMDKEDQDRIAPSMGSALINAFTWDHTPEGWRFWDKVLDHYMFDDPLPPLP